MADTKPYACYDPEEINELLKQINEDPTVAPRGVGQIDFFHKLIHTLTGAQLMNIAIQGEPEQNDVEDIMEEVVYEADDEE